MRTEEKTERAATRLCFRIAEHDADLFTDLVGKEDEALRLTDLTCETPHGLTHHPSLKSDGGVAHLTIELILRDGGRDGVGNDDVDRAGADKCL